MHLLSDRRDNFLRLQSNYCYRSSDNFKKYLCPACFLTSSCAFVRSPIWLSNKTANTNNHFLFSAGNWMKHLENSRNPKKCTKDRSMRLKVEHQQQKQTLKCTCFTKLLNTRSSWSRHLLRNKQSDVIQLLYKYYGKPFTFTCSLYYVI